MAEQEYKRRSTDTSVLYGIKDWWPVIISTGFLINSVYTTREKVQSIEARTTKLESDAAETKSEISAIKEAVKRLPKIEEYLITVIGSMNGLKNR